MVGHCFNHYLRPHKLWLQIGSLSAAPTVVNHPHPVSHLVQGWFFKVFSLYMPLLLPQHFVYNFHPLYQPAGILVYQVVLFRDMVGQVVRHLGLSTEHQEIGGLTSTGVGILRYARMTCGSIRSHSSCPQQRSRLRSPSPSIWLLRSTTSIALWMVPGGAGLVHSPEVAEVAHQLGLELSALVQVNLFWQAEITECMLVQHTSHCRG